MSKKEALPKDWREGRRLRAWQLYQQGWKQKDIAEALGVTEGAVSQWMRRAKKDGPDGLRHQPPPGPQPKLMPGTTRPVA
ncbi:helix-turn-helix domain-containing protein [Ktedonobacter sp. SOSP1-85]|uniref:helix-turn-helix domain-containing protein n=1 Tax=Ktedonobacter sp. SOSP1-85 TaxID=2778367 RepID=UPI001F459FA4|nr:helix-turn-helix domain-containing protein [Ktedonobacter sp. SOSP1-85]